MPLSLDSRKRDILATMGVDVWGLRGDGGVDAGVAGEDVAGDSVAAEVTAAADGEAAAVVAAEIAAPATVNETAESTAAAADPPSTVSADTVIATESTAETAAAESTVATESTTVAAAKSPDPNPDSLARVAAEVAACEQCELHRARNNTVPGGGNPRADWLFVGEAPGRDEDAQGEPFVGRAGKLLDMMIAALGMKRDTVFVANVLKCRPPDNRDPLPGEIEMCEAYLHRQLALIQPKVIVALGRVSAQALLKTGDALGTLRGAAHRYGPAGIPLVVTYHPAYLLRSPEQKSKAWDDLWLAKGIAEAGATLDVS
ncbi:MAG: uracil-DNA glycosylase [Gammaproteobacteria bacterium]|nr:uracil-DNA glycosylase [Gammaproteobacteria bacterium]